MAISELSMPYEIASVVSLPRKDIMTQSLYGEMQGIVGASLAEIKSLELKPADEEGMIEPNLEKEEVPF